MLAGPPSTVQKARRLRRDMSWPEVLLWQRFRQRPAGLKIRRQHPAGPFILDFFCSQARLAIEVDGLGHEAADRRVRDEERSCWLARHGVDVLRVSASDVSRSPDEIADSIVQACLARLNPLRQPPAGPPPRSGEETKE